MNAKKAKALRHSIKQFASLTDKSVHQAAEYTIAQHTASIKDEDGNYQTVAYAVTHFLTPTSPKGLYRKAKRIFRGRSGTKGLYNHNSATKRLRGIVDEQLNKRITEFA